MKKILTGLNKYGTTDEAALDAQTRATEYHANQIAILAEGKATITQKEDAIEVIKSIERFSSDYEDVDIYIPKRAIQAIRKNAKKIIAFKDL